ncbi:methyltransferase [Rathayibacter toxicus]|nr:class I SAM-dependent methyltransferase [Rathayibacter toxicus]QWL48895.1 class I SAM-dependent methyltransferase [Rathayibacter toxicus]
MTTIVHGVMTAERRLEHMSFVTRLSGRFGQDAVRLAIRLRTESDTPDKDARLLEEGVPEGHVFGSMDICGLRIACERGVFTPRLSTIDLVWRAAQRSADVEFGRAPIVVDIGAGTGAIALVLAAAVDATCIGIDTAAVDLARRNALALSLENRTTFFVADARGPEFAALLPEADVVVCNPPYIPDRIRLPTDVVKNQPAAALYSGPDGMGLTGVCLRLGLSVVRPGGFLLLEHDPAQTGVVAALARRRGGWVADYARGGTTVLRREAS